MNKKYLQNLYMIFVLVLSVFGITVSPASAHTESTIEAQTSIDGLPTDRIIIKYKDGTDASVSPAQGSQLSRLESKARVNIRYVRTMSVGGAHIMQLPERLPLDQVQAIVDQLKTLPEVEYAEPDLIMQYIGVPNDEFYLNQWHYYETWGINTPGAWDITNGEESVVIAVLDTGITVHGDLDGRTVPGYDFVSEDFWLGNFETYTANDGDGRDNNPADPGDWITVAEDNGTDKEGFFQGCGASDSSWHGTHVAGTIGALSNNTVGVAGVNWFSKILPVRVLGKCGGYTSDVADAMRWAAGLPVAGVSDNSNPADVLNLSLGGLTIAQTCPVIYQEAIDAITAAGSTVVVAAGNSGIDTSYSTPANCAGVITVAATDRSGDMAWYSNFGSLIEISAPGGDEINGVLSTLNDGTTVPGNEIYAQYFGTSMATPHVSGVVSLMYSVNLGITPSQVLEILQDTATAFSGTSTCNTADCGAGIVNATAAVEAAEKPDLVITNVTISPATPLPGEPFDINVTIKNQGGSETETVVYRDVYINNEPVISPEDGCPISSGDYFRSDYNDGLADGSSDTKSVTVTAGLASGSHQIWVYADANCLNEESIEDNNKIGPILLNIGVRAYGDFKGDYNGDGKDDVAVFRPSNGTWYIQGQGPFVYGQSGDIPVPADYNGDGKDDIAVFRPTTSTWYVRGQGSFSYGTVGDIPVVADYNGDGKADIAVFRPTNSRWYVYGVGSFEYGTVGDIPVVADYTGDGKADIAVFRPTNSTWYIYGVGPRVYGTIGDMPVVADYDGDGKADIAVFRPTNSTWYLYGIGPRVYGTIGDIPVIGDYNGDGKADIAVFRPTNSTWYIYGVGPSVYGTIGDIPV